MMERDETRDFPHHPCLAGAGTARWRGPLLVHHAKDMLTLLMPAMAMQDLPPAAMDGPPMIVLTRTAQPLAFVQRALPIAASRS